MHLSHCTLYANSAQQGSGIYADHGELLTIENSIIAFGASGAAIRWGTPTIRCCNLYANEGGDWIYPLEDLLGVDGNVSEDPLFCNADEGNFTLHSDSGCAEENNAACGQIGAHGIGCGPYTEVDHLPVRSDGVLLAPALPNPFSNSTRITYRIPGDTAVSPVALSIYDPAGRLVRTLVRDRQQEGTCTVIWDGKSDAGGTAAAGVYFYQLRAGGERLTKQVILVH